MKASSCAVVRHYSRCTRIAISTERASSRRRPMSTSSLASSSTDSNATSRCNHRHHRPVVGEEALLMKPAGASGGEINEGSRERSMTIDWGKMRLSLKYSIVRMHTAVLQQSWSCWDCGPTTYHISGVLTSKWVGEVCGRDDDRRHATPVSPQRSSEFLPGQLHISVPPCASFRHRPPAPPDI